MNKLTAVIGTVLVLSNPHLALQPAYAARISTTVAQTVSIPTLTLSQIISQKTTSESLIVPVVAKTITPTTSIPETPQQIAEQLVTEHFGASHYAAFAKIVNRESTWNPDAVNAESGACGLAQVNPCSKLVDHSVAGQLTWMISYIDQRYGTPENAWHAEQTKGWY